MLSIESALVKKTILKWFNAKFKRQFNKINPSRKLKYERQNSINWKKDKCVTCKFPMKLESTNHKTPDDGMALGYEHNPLRNIYIIEQIEESDHMKNLESYYEIFKDFIMIWIGLLALLNNFNRHDFINLATEKFVEERLAGDEIQHIKYTINQTEIKIALSTTRGKVPKFNLKIYAYVYDELLSFPRSDIDYETITTNKFFLHVNRLVRGQIAFTSFSRNRKYFPLYSRLL